MVERVAGGGVLRIDVFDADGTYAGTLPEGTPLPVLYLPDGGVGYAGRDSRDVERLVVGRLTTG